MGFRNASGQEVAFTVPHEPALNPIGGARRAASGRRGLGRRPQRPRLHRLHVRRPERRQARHVVDQRRRVHDHFVRHRRRARHDAGAGPRVRHDVPLLDDRPLHERRHRHPPLRWEQVAVLRLERQRAAESGRDGHRYDPATINRHYIDVEPDAAGRPRRRRDDGGRRRDHDQRAGGGVTVLTTVDAKPTHIKGTIYRYYLTGDFTAARPAR